MPASDLIQPRHLGHRAVTAAEVACPHARLASRLLARLCRTGLVTHRVSMKGFTFCDDSPFPSFLGAM